MTKGVAVPPEQHNSIFCSGEATVEGTLHTTGHIEHIRAAAQSFPYQEHQWFSAYNCRTGSSTLGPSPGMKSPCGTQGFASAVISSVPCSPCSLCKHSWLQTEAWRAGESYLGPGCFSGKCYPQGKVGPQNSSILLSSSLAQVEPSPSAALTVKEDDSFPMKLPKENSMEGCLGDCSELPDDWVSHHTGTARRVISAVHAVTRHSWREHRGCARSG